MVKVTVPATSANLGPGFDTLGLALNLYNTFMFEEIKEGLEITGCQRSLANEDNLVYRAMFKTFERTGYFPKGVRIHIESHIPISRGLGSSATCILGGIVGANCLSGQTLSETEILELATEMEGHPDNIAAALFGGLVISFMEGDKVIYNRLDIHEGIKFIALIPNFTLSTEEARKVLPDRVQYKDAIHNISRTAILLSSLSNGRFDLLKHGFEDVLHQPYRGQLIPNYSGITLKCREIGALGSYLSGAGPTVMAIVDKEDKGFMPEIREYLRTLGDWDVKELSLNRSGLDYK